MKTDPGHTYHERDKNLTPEAFRARRYRDAEDIRPLAEHPLKNRIRVDGIDVAWMRTGWSRAFDEEQLDVKIQHHSLALYENNEPIGVAMFDGYLFNDYVGTLEFIRAADSVTQEMYDFSEGVKSALEYLADDSFEFEPGMRVIEFRRLVMRSDHSKTSKWVAPVRAFIRKKLKCSSRAWNYALVLRPFPLEYENGARETGMIGGETLMRRRRAMARLYKRALGVELAVPETDVHWWMARLL